MRKEILLILSVLLCVNMISAVQYFQSKSILGDNVVRNHIYVLRGDDYTTDLIKDNRPLELSIDYRSYIDDWNLVNKNYSVDYCNFTITFIPANFIGSPNQSTYVIFQKNLTYNYENAHYFIRLNKKDGFIADMDCKFSNNKIAILDIPADISISTPTPSCKACQYYEWTELEKTIAKSDDIGLKKVKIVGYMQKLIAINYKNGLALFWIFLIMMVMLSLGLVFTGVYGIYLYIDSLIKRK